jgi:hypothetical protein
MRRSLGLRIGTLILVVFTTTAPAFAAPRDDSPIGSVERAIQRVFNQIRRIITPSDTLYVPK